jgi:hypothetical protein
MACQRNINFTLIGAHTKQIGFMQSISRDVQLQLHESSHLKPDIKEAKRVLWVSSNYSFTSFFNYSLSILPFFISEKRGSWNLRSASCGICLSTFRDNVSVPSSRVKSPTGTLDPWGWETTDFINIAAEAWNQRGFFHVTVVSRCIKLIAWNQFLRCAGAAFLIQFYLNQILNRI